MASCAASVTHGDLECTSLSHSSDGSTRGLPCAGLCPGSNAESSTPAAELSRCRCLAHGKPRHELMLGHGSFANSMNGPRNFVGVTFSLLLAWLLVERQHRISPHLFQAKWSQLYQSAFSRLASCFTSLQVFCFAQTMTGCILSPTLSVCHAVLQGTVPRGWTGSATREHPGRAACVNLHQSRPSGSHMVMLFSRQTPVFRVTLWVCHPCSHRIQSWGILEGAAQQNWAPARSCSSPALFTHPWPVTAAAHGKGCLLSRGAPALPVIACWCCIYFSCFMGKNISLSVLGLFFIEIH